MGSRPSRSDVILDVVRIHNPGDRNFITLIILATWACPAVPAWMPFRSWSGISRPAARPGSSTGVLHHVMLRGSEGHPHAPAPLCGRRYRGGRAEEVDVPDSVPKCSKPPPLRGGGGPLPVRGASAPAESTPRGDPGGGGLGALRGVWVPGKG